MRAVPAASRPAFPPARDVEEVSVSDLDGDGLSLEALTGSLREYRDPMGIELLGRVEPFYRWQEARRRLGYWPYSRATAQAPRPSAPARTMRAAPSRASTLPRRTISAWR